ncbi:hypothetical protein [Streptomyces radicis]|uniref:Uncharacterized protein n=1 Tax=Streptomyces radicis TaxID=1750517 RepID=A0A3A9WC83_9ACTN|nr:hypothetical protein [Streptomyces radicis]RKN10605.1 hypothetical protein D7319_09290 [Streptomyces radicis]RKN24865.1 hypothetical protein D7318_10470 [Streptomyces radicis]
MAAVGSVGFTVEVEGATGMRTGAWAVGETLTIAGHPGRAPLATVRLRPAAGREARGARRGLSASGEVAAAEVVLAEVTVAEVEERARLGGAAPHPALDLFAPDGAPLATVEPREPVAWPRLFDVMDAEGRPLGTVARSRTPLLRRATWAIHPADGGPPVTGRQGTAAGWLAFTALLPLWLLVLLISLLVALGTFGLVTQLLTWGRPKSVAWRRGPLGRRPLTFGHARGRYRAAAKGPLDERLVHAQAALHRFTALHAT